MKNRIVKRAIVPIFCLIVLVLFGLKTFTPAQAPKIQTTTLTGETFSSASLQQKPWYVEFWSVNCSTCLADFDKLIELQRKLSALGGQVVAVAIAQDNEKMVKQYAEPLQSAGIIVIHDKNSAIATAFSHDGITPYGFLIRPDGHIGRIHAGKLNVEATLQALE